jgi:preprotein translocase subunit YajC
LTGLNIAGWLSFIAQTTTPVTSTTKPSIFDFFSSLPFTLLLAFLVFYVFIGKGKRGDEKKRKDTLAGLKKGDRVQTIGGIIGSVVDVRDQEVVLKVDESSNTKIRFLRSAVHRVVDDDAKTESK